MVVVPSFDNSLSFRFDWSRFSKQFLRVPRLQCSKIISEVLCRHISNFKCLIIVLG